MLGRNNRLLELRVANQQSGDEFAVRALDNFERTWNTHFESKMFPKPFLYVLDDEETTEVSLEWEHTRGEISIMFDIQGNPHSLMFLNYKDYGGLDETYDKVTINFAIQKLQEWFSRVQVTEPKGD